MKVCIIGAGYVGLTTAAVLANFGHHVHCIDIDKQKVNSLNKGSIPIYEPGLEEIVQKNIQLGNLTFSTHIKDAITKAEIVFIAVGTPSTSDGSPNLTAMNQVVDTISESLESYKTIIVKSTVPPGTSEMINKKLLEKGINQSLFDVVMNPEFLKEGTAINDTLHPDKIVVGVNHPKPVQTIQALYRDIHAPYIITNLTGAEMIKYASNAFLATKISFINEMARICDAYNVDIDDVALGLGTDPRIGPYFLKAGLGYGGSCLPKDTKALLHASLKQEVKPELLSATRKVNDEQITFLIKKVNTYLNQIKGKKIAVWGMTFKPNTDDIRESQAIKLIKKLVDKGADVNAYDPMASTNLPNVSIYRDPYKAVKDVDLLIIATEWDECKNADWIKVKEAMKGRVIIDGRNCIDRRTLRQLGFNYSGVGRS